MHTQIFPDGGRYHIETSPLINFSCLFPLIDYGPHKSIHVKVFGWYTYHKMIQDKWSCSQCSHSGHK